MNNEISSSRLKSAMENNKIRAQELSDKSGVSKGSISQYVHGTYVPSPSSSEKLGLVLNVNPQWLMGDNVSMEREPTTPPKAKEGVKIPVLDGEITGIPLADIESVAGIEEITSEMALTGTYFGLQIHETGMEPRICPGDIVIFRQQSEADSDDIVIASINGNSLICRKLKKYHDSFALVPFNPGFEPEFFKATDKSVQIYGKAVELRGKV
ncbi:MAG: helix-turn-helix domain-containing protein [Bacteroidales bacterium]|nr:helix-turn-helix domain-containing protein [Bacteroidales bacterium]